MAFKMTGAPFPKNRYYNDDKTNPDKSKLGAAAGSAQAQKDFETETESTTPPGATKEYKAAYDA
ncbi:MAG: hypothetical protein ACKVKR_16570, partial [Pseudomonadales bacterium]